MSGLPNIKINGPERKESSAPMWQAEVEVVEWKHADGHFHDHRTIRDLFINRSPLKLNGTKNVLLPGTFVALCRIKNVEVNLDQTYKWSAGEFYQTPLLIQAPNYKSEWFSNDPFQKIQFPVCTCIGGEIDLSRMKENSDKWKKSFNLSDNAKNLKAHSSGYSLEGEATFKWDPKPIKGSFLVTSPFPDKKDKLHITLDRELMKSDKNGKVALDAFQKTFQDLSKILNSDAELRWLTLDLTKNNDIPQFRWEITRNDPKTAELQFEKGEWELIIADQSPENMNVAPRSLMTASPIVKIQGDTNKLQIIIDTGNEPPATGAAPLARPTFTFQSDAAGNETVAIVNVKTVYDPLTTAIALRKQYNLPEPVRKREIGDKKDETPVEPAILWGAMPLEDGWAQLPFLNLTEQIYIDTEIINKKAIGGPPNPSSLLLSGAATFGNDTDELYKIENGERPWNITLLNGSGYSGEWLLDLSTKKIESKVVTISEPELVLNGFFWLGTQPPSAEDALPSLDNWFQDLHPISLRTKKEDDDFPSPYLLRFSKINFKKTNKPEVASPAKPLFSYPTLKDLSFVYEADENTLKTLLVDGLWKEILPPPEKLNEYKANQPLVWRRHPSLPAVQSLSLTQSKTQPNYPSPSRQLAPFGLPFKSEVAFPVPDNWMFGTNDAGAFEWMRCQADLKIDQAQQWAKAKYLWLASLSLPGLIFDPNSPADMVISSSGFLPAQYLFGLSYLDELNALAQLPKDEKTPPPAPEAPPAALQRETYFAYWNTLSERAYLAKHDADEILTRQGAQTFAQGLVEPFQWAVKATLEDKSYPGKLTLAEAGGGRIELQKETALRGISGKFTNTGNALRLDDTGTAKYEIIAGTMSALLNNGKLRDQRGLNRGNTVRQADSFLLKTDLEHETFKPKDPKDPKEISVEKISLYSLSQPVDLKIGATSSWQLWLRDIPAVNKIFTRQANPQDVNDTEASSTEKVHLSGYEWRLGTKKIPGATEEKFLDLFGFHFYPLALETAVFDDKKITSVELTGRLQLPNDGGRELPESGNTVHLTFSMPDLTLTKINSQDKGIWNLTADQSPFSPRLRWESISYDVNSGELKIDTALEFYLFESRWLIKLTRKPDSHFEYVAADLGNTGDGNIGFTGIDLKFDNKMNPQTLEADLTFIWGGVAAALKINAVATINLFKTEKVNIEAFLLLATKKLPLNISSMPLNNRALQIEFNTDKARQKDLYLFPGMGLSQSEEIKGFAVMSFDISANRLSILQGCAEMIIPCAWGTVLQDITLAAGGTAQTPTAGQTFGSSAGNIYAGYTLNYSRSKWISSLLLNGVLEIKNLLSFPIPPAEIDRDATVIHYESESRTISADLAGRMNTVKDFMTANPDLSIGIEGHADGEGTPEYNLELSTDRAENAKKALVAAGIKEYRILAFGFGETMPIASNDTEEGKAANRRVEFRTFPTFHPPAAPDGAPPPLNHIRHTMRVLFNQHEVPAEIVVNGSDEFLFNLYSDKNDPKKGRSWQFPAIVEHQLVDINFDAGGNLKPASNDRRWTAVQEVRLTTPGKFSDYLQTIFDKNLNTIFPTHKELAEQELSRVSAGFHYKPLLKLLLQQGPDGKNQITRLENALIVESSAIHQISSLAAQSIQFTNLQYLPQGIQRGIISVPEDFEMSRAGLTEKQWTLITTPFLGRLQKSADDKIDGAIIPADSALRVDPVLYLKKTRQPGIDPPILPRIFSSWGGTDPVPVEISQFDFASFHRWKRLDQNTLVESWFRLQHPPDEKKQTKDNNEKFQSVTASLPADSPGRLGRSSMLNRLFDEKRKSLPPSEDNENSNADLSPDADLTWRRDALLTLQGFSDRVKDEIKNDKDDQPYTFYFVAAQIYTSGLRAADKTDYFPAVTMLPANLNTAAGAKLFQPVSFAVSPYLGFDYFQATGDVSGTVVAVTELLCLNPAGDRLETAASKVWYKEDLPELPEKESELFASWGKELHSRIALDSAFAILRIRKIIAIKDDRQPGIVKIDYSFLIVSPVPAPQLTVEGNGSLRFPLDSLRFAEGQFGGTKLPPTMNNFEVAVPLTTGVQSIYLDPLPFESPEDRTWGLSTIRFSIQYTENKIGVIGNSPKEPVDNLWWSVASHHVQFTKPLSENSALPDKKKNFLPEKFRARSIHSLLPTVPNLKLPQKIKEIEPQQDKPQDSWQAILPGAFNYLIVGGRAGAPFVFNHFLLRHDITSDFVVASGNVPVQHRFPRPVALPKNPVTLVSTLFEQGDFIDLAEIAAKIYLKENSLTHFLYDQLEPKTKQLLEDYVDDNSQSADFLKALTNDFNKMLQGKSIYDENRFQNVKLSGTARKLLARNSAGDELIHLNRMLLEDAYPDFLAKNRFKEYAPLPSILQTWRSYFEPLANLRYYNLPFDNAFIVSGQNEAHGLEVTLQKPEAGIIPQNWDGEIYLFPETRPLPAELKDWTLSPELVTGDRRLTLFRQPDSVDPAGPVRLLFTPKDPKKPEDKWQERLRDFLAGLAHGADIQLRIKAAPKIIPVEGYSQDLTLSLRFAQANKTLLPFQSVFAQFEDPEYNRRLASQPAQASRLVQYRNRQVEIIAATDRREYNTTGELLLGIFNDEFDLSGKLTFSRVDNQGIITVVSSENFPVSGGQSGKNQLISFDLSNFALFVDDTLLVLIEPNEVEGKKPEPMELRVRIVALPVVPVTTSAYALLRQEMAPNVVECRRFAWSPQPARIEILNPLDLKEGFVRRRAVFQWKDTERIASDSKYALQKIAANGSTHFPVPDSDENE